MPNLRSTHTHTLTTECDDERRNRPTIKMNNGSNETIPSQRISTYEVKTNKCILHKATGLGRPANARTLLLLIVCSSFSCAAAAGAVGLECLCRAMCAVVLIFYNPIQFIKPTEPQPQQMCKLKDCCGVRADVKWARARGAGGDACVER